VNEQDLREAVRKLAASAGTKKGQSRHSLVDSAGPVRVSA
jgi:hypothetical protein